MTQLWVLAIFGLTASIGIYIILHGSWFIPPILALAAIYLVRRGLVFYSQTETNKLERTVKVDQLEKLRKCQDHALDFATIIGQHATDESRLQCETVDFLSALQRQNHVQEMDLQLQTVQAGLEHKTAINVEKQSNLTNKQLEISKDIKNQVKQDAKNDLDSAQELSRNEIHRQQETLDQVKNEQRRLAENSRIKSAQQISAAQKQADELLKRLNVKY